MPVHRARHDDHDIARSDHHGVSIKLCDAASAHDEQRLLDVIVFLFANIATWRDRHHDQLRLRAREHHATEVCIRTRLMGNVDAS